MRVQQAEKPRRWGRPFGDTALADREVDVLLSLPFFNEIDPRDFPEDLALDGILANDTRIIRADRDDVIYRQGEYGTSIFLVLNGSVQSSMTPGGGHERKAGPKKASMFRSLSRLWHGSGQKSEPRPDHGADSNDLSKRKLSTPAGMFSPPVLPLVRNDVFGVIGALTRTPRCASVTVTEDDTQLLELRWPAVRDLCQWSDSFRTGIDELYCEWGYWSCLQGCALFQHVDDDALDIIGESSNFERYGEFAWTHRFQKAVSGVNGHGVMAAQEPVIAEQGHYLDGLLLIHSGFARLTEKSGHEELTLDYATKNDVIGLSEIAGGVGAGGILRFPSGLRTVGYVDLVRIPTEIVEAHILPSLPRNYDLRGRRPSAEGASVPVRSFTEFLIDRRFTNGAKAMVINTDRCVNCDDCVRACAAAHDGVPRFERRGATHHNLMIAGACMHCADPVCLIDCPTAAIHRDKTTGTVIIDDATCIGCAACANACPYDNIHMAEQRDDSGAFLIDGSGVQMLRAEKCDLCIKHKAGPACERACPHDALQRVNIRDTSTLLEWSRA